jgi:hypothetical protein
MDKRRCNRSFRRVIGRQGDLVALPHVMTQTPPHEDHGADRTLDRTANELFLIISGNSGRVLNRCIWTEVSITANAFCRRPGIDPPQVLR